MNTVMIGKIIKRHRDNKGISQEVLSGLADVDTSYLCKIEAGAHNLSVMVLYKIADALGISASDILRAAEELEKEG
ncbi:MAG: helix-turn-helix domain-containing protein [Oscillospiraceae bacterium]|nr:helix-turn-helix domain-containing protein [Oscillospiraceae bacterium]